MTPTRLWSRTRRGGSAPTVAAWGVSNDVFGTLPGGLTVESVGPQDLARPDIDVLVCPATQAAYAVACGLLADSTMLVLRAARLDGLPEDVSRAAVIVVATEDEADLVRRRPGVSPVEVVAIPPAYDAVQRIRSTLDDRLILSVGPLTQERRHGDVIRALAEVSEQMPDWRLRIVGGGARRGALMGEARRHGLSDRVEVVESDDPDDSSAEWVSAGIAAVTSRHDGLAVTASALAAGVPVVGYDSLGGPRALVRHGRTGLLVPPGDFRALGEALLRLASHEAARRGFAAEGTHALQALDPPVVGELWGALLEGADHGAVDERRDGPPPITPAEARTEILAWVGRVAAGLGDPWWVLPTPHGGDPVLAMPYASRDRMLAALAADPGPAYLWLGEPELAGRPARTGPPAEMVGPFRQGAVSVLTLAPAPGPPGRPHHLETGAGVDVEFWTESGGQLFAPRPNVFGRRLRPDHPTTDALVCGVEVRTLPMLTRPSVHECSFPIDVVYTYVDGDDPAWRERRDRRLGEMAGEPQASGEARFRARDELRYSMRSVHLFAPWVRTIHLVVDGVTDRQRPDWLGDDPRVRMVDHREILPAADLPTFNSHAIESGLHRVPGLAEHFVYLNDDVLLGRPLPPTAFFTPSGLPHVFPDVWPIGLEDRAERPDLMAGATNRRLLEQEYGVTITLTLAHAPHPHRVSLLAELGERFPDELARTAASPFRSVSDVSPLSSLAQHVGLVTGRAVVAAHDNRFVNLAASGLAGRFRALRLRDADSICLADDLDYALPEARVSELLDDFLEDYYPVAAPWEKSRP